MSSHPFQKKTKVFCNCSKCCKDNLENGLFVSKSTRARHRQRKNDQTPNSSLESNSSLSVSELEESSSSSSFEISFQYYPEMPIIGYNDSGCVYYFKKSIFFQIFINYKYIFKGIRQVFLRTIPLLWMI
jgi:hypothetical protein